MSMMILSPKFDKGEMEILCKFAENRGGEIKIICAVDENKLYYEGIIEGKKTSLKVDSPHRMLEIGGLYLLEEKNSIGVWSVGDVDKEKKYLFWGEYGTLDNAVKSL